MISSRFHASPSRDIVSQASFQRPGQGRLVKDQGFGLTAEELRTRYRQRVRPPSPPVDRRSTPPPPSRRPAVRLCHGPPGRRGRVAPSAHRLSTDSRHRLEHFMSRRARPVPLVHDTPLGQMLDRDTSRPWNGGFFCPPDWRAAGCRAAVRPRRKLPHTLEPVLRDPLQSGSESRGPVERPLPPPRLVQPEAIRTAREHHWAQIPPSLARTVPIASIR